jgi:hypothetical protein
MATPRKPLGDEGGAGKFMKIVAERHTPEILQSPA